MRRPARISIICTVCRRKRIVSSFYMTRRELEESCRDYVCTDHLPKR